MTSGWNWSGFCGRGRLLLALCDAPGPLLQMADRQSGLDVARLPEYTPVQISRIRHRFIDERMSGLSDKPRSGRPRVYGREMTSEIVAMTVQPPLRD